MDLYVLSGDDGMIHKQVGDETMTVLVKAGEEVNFTEIVLSPYDWDEEPPGFVYGYWGSDKILKDVKRFDARIALDIDGRPFKAEFKVIPENDNNDRVKHDH